MDMGETKITSATSDELIEATWPNKENLLRHFAVTRAAANVLDAERDRLGKYIREKIPVGRYGKMVYTRKSAGSRFYANSDGNHALEFYPIVKPTEREVERIAALGETEMVTIRNHDGEILFRGYLIDNTLLYTRKDQENIVLAEIPEVPK